MSDNPTYTTRTDAIHHQIIVPIEASGVARDAEAEFDVDAIADAVLGGYADGYAQTVTADEFWDVVSQHIR